ncbi:MAG: hypothetical protein ACT4PU_09760 [Planctomycetota bacterium]
MAAATFLRLLLLADALFIGLHLLLLATPLLSSPLYSLETDRGYAEWFQYLKELWIVALLLLLLQRTRELGYLAWALLFAYLLSDDALKLHERWGYALGERWQLGPVLGLRPDDLGEVAVCVLVGGSLLLLIGWVHRRGSPAFRQASRSLLRLLVLLACFGVGLDLLGMTLERGSVAKHVVGALEDGGEMIVMSLIAWQAFRLHAQAEPA